MINLNMDNLGDWNRSHKFSVTKNAEISLVGKLCQEALFLSDINRYGLDEFLYSALICDNYNFKVHFYHYRITWLRFNISKFYIERFLVFFLKNGFDYRYSGKIIFVGDSLKELLSVDSKYVNYEGRVRLYGKFRGVDNTTKINIGNIFKVDILNEDGSVRHTIE